jgi:hypothetical protein
MKPRLFLMMTLLAGCQRSALEAGPDNVDMGGPAPAAGAPCELLAAGAAGRPVFAWLGAADLSLLWADRHVSTPYTFGGDSHEMPLFVAPFRVSAVDGFVASAAQVEYHLPSARRFEAVLLSRDGQVAWKKVRPWEGDGYDFWLGRNGLMLLATPSSGNLFVLPDGSELPTVHGAPLAPPGKDGWVPFQLDWLADNSVRFQWVSPRGEIVPGAYSVSGGLAKWVGDRLVYASNQGGRPSVVSERPGDARAFPSSPALFLDGARNTWALFGSQSQGSYWMRFNAESGEIAPLLPLPAQQFVRDLQIDDDGALLVSQTNALTASISRTTDLGKSYVLIGHEVSRGHDAFLAYVEAHGGTYLIHAESQLFVPTAPPQLQVARPSDGIHRDLTEGNGGAGYSLSPDGLCLVRAKPAGSEMPDLQIVDVRSEETLTLPLTSLSEASPVWIE